MPTRPTEPHASSPGLILVRRALVVVLIVLLGLTAASAWKADAVYDSVWSLEFSPDASLLVVGSSAGVTLYEPGGAGRLLHVPGAHGSAFSPDGSRLAVAAPGRIAVFDTASRSAVFEAPIPDDWNTNPAFSPDARLLALLGGDTNTLQLFDLATGERLWTRAAHEDADFAVAFSPDGAVIATGGSDRDAERCEVRLWSAEGGEALHTIEIRRLAWVREIQFGPDGEMIVGADLPNLVYDITNPTAPAEVQHTAMYLLELPIAVSPDGSLVVGRRDVDRSWKDVFDFTVTVVERPSGRNEFVTPSIPGLSGAAGFLPNGRLRIASSGGIVETWDVAARRRLEHIPGNRAPRHAAHWFILAAAGAIWLIAWTGAHLRGPHPLDRRADWLLVPAVGGCAGIALAVLHAYEVADPWDPTDSFGMVTLAMLLPLAGLLVLVPLARITRSSGALLVALLAFPAAFIVAGVRWVDFASSI